MEMENTVKRSMIASLAAVSGMMAAAAMAAQGPAARKSKTKQAAAPRRSATSRVPNGLTFRSLRRAFNSGWEPNVTVKAERKSLYLNSHARAMDALKRALAAR